MTVHASVSSFGFLYGDKTEMSVLLIGVTLFNKS